MACRLFSPPLISLCLLFAASPCRFVRAALHLAAAAADHESVSLLLSGGANPSIVNSCGLTPGACFLRTPDAVVATTTAAGNAADVREIRRALRGHRERFGHVRRLADTSTKRVAVEAVGDRTTVAVHRFVGFALKVPCRGFLMSLRLSCWCCCCGMLAVWQGGEHKELGQDSSLFIELIEASIIEAPWHSVRAVNPTRVSRSPVCDPRLPLPRFSPSPARCPA